MARTRRQSVPPPKRAGAGAGSADLLSSIPQSIASLSTHGKGAKPCPQTDALARMTIELNMRAISSQAQRLENDLRLLVRNTEDDKEYRAKNETRISEIWTELLAVRTRVNEVHDGQEAASIRYEKCKQEADQWIRNFQQEISGFKSLCSNLSTQLDSLPTMADLDLVATQPLSDDSRLHHLARLQNERLESAGVRGPPETIVPPIRCHMQEVLSSTRRWNRDHKTTDKPEAIFIADYLKRQSRRNTRLAVYIQRAIRRRVRLRLADSKLHPTSLEEFCQVVKWNDVLEVVEEVLVNSEEDTVRALS